MKVQFDKSQYSTVGRSSCLVHVQWMKDQSRTVNQCYLNACMQFLYIVLCLMCVWVGGWMGGEGRGYGWGGGDLGPPSPVICIKNHEL